MTFFVRGLYKSSVTYIGDVGMVDIEDAEERIKKSECLFLKKLRDRLDTKNYEIVKNLINSKEK